MELAILILILLTVIWICGKILGIPGYLGSIVGTIIAIYVVSKH